MNDAIIRCPNCGTEIPVSEVLSAQIRADLEATLRAEQGERLTQAVAAAAEKARATAAIELQDLRNQLAERAREAKAAEERELDLRRQARALEEAKRKLAEEVRAETEERLREQGERKLAEAVASTEAKVREQQSAALEALQARVAEQEEKVRTAQANELALRKDKQALEDRARELDIEIARKVDAAKQALEESIRKTAAEEQDLKLKEKEKQIADLRKALEDAKRKAEQGSQEGQGEVLEIDVQAGLERRFPQDVIEPVARGIRGADLLQVVRNAGLQRCGTIVWETKNTKHWSAGWIDKLKQDQVAVGASLAVLVSVVLPEEIQEFGRVDGVWVASLRAWPALAVALREQLIQVAFAHAAAEGKGEKMELLYRYLSGDQFRARVQGIVEAFTAMQTQLDRERRAMERLWREREKQIERVVTNTVGMYGEMRGLIGTSLPEIPALALDDAEGLLDGPDEP
jgi:hypothetical protein